MALLLGSFAGYFYSHLLTLTSARFLHFFPLVSVLRSLFFVFLFGSLTALVQSVHETTRSHFLPFLPLLLMAGHFLGWSLVAGVHLPGALLEAGSLLLVLLVLVALGGIPLIDRFQSRTLLYSSPVVLIGLVVSQYILVGALPLSMVENRLRYPTPIENEYRDPVNTRAVFLDPFSLPLEEAVRAYPMLLPEVPEGTKTTTVVLDAFREDFFDKRLSDIHLTPYLSALADENLYFPEFRTQAAWTKPSTASLFTGRYVRQHGVYIGGGARDNKEGGRTRLPESEEDVLENYFGHALPDRAVTLAERMRRQDVRTFGLTEIEHISGRYDFDQGFDEYLTIPPGFKHHPDYLLRRPLFWLLRTQPEDAFLYLHLKGPHYPYPLGGQNREFWERNTYGEGSTSTLSEWNLPSRDILELTQMILPPEFDKDIRQETDFLRHLYGSEVYSYDRIVLPRYERMFRNLGLWASMNYVVTSDHGEGIYDHDRYYGHGYNLYEEAVNVPLILKPGENLRRNIHGDQSRRDFPLESIDLTATLLDLAEANRSGVQGRSMLPALRSGADTFPDTYTFSEKGGINTIVRVAVTRPPWKYIYNLDRDSGELYNLQEDPTEQNPTKNYPERARELRSALFEKLGKTGEIEVEAPVRNIDEQGREALKGLGYLR